MSVSVPTTASLPPLLPGEEIYDLHGPVGIPYPWETVIFWCLAAMAACWIVFKLRAYILRRMAEAEAVAAAAPPPPPDPLEEALKALSRLRGSPIWSERRMKDICEHLTLILKVFLRDRFRLGIGAAATTAELSTDLRRKRVEEALRRRIEELFDLCDDVKYARGELGETSLDDLYLRTHELLQRREWGVRSRGGAGGRV
ncbi:MAG: hypothetical protein WA705_17980 [Candidatus Ozemobacteraceae bacterium]